MTTRPIASPAASCASRRRFLGCATAGALAPLATLSFAGSRRAGGNRFVLVILRGGMDGLSAVPAVGDPEFAAARGPLGQFGGSAPLPLDATFALHPQLAELHASYQRGGPRDPAWPAVPRRSHFDGRRSSRSGRRPRELPSARPRPRSNGERARGSTAVAACATGRGLGRPWRRRCSQSLPTRRPVRRMYAPTPPARALERSRPCPGRPRRDDGPADKHVCDERRRRVRPGSFRGLAEGGRVPRRRSGPQSPSSSSAAGHHANQSNPNAPGQRPSRARAAFPPCAPPCRDDAWQRTVVVVPLVRPRGGDHGTLGNRPRSAAPPLLASRVRGGRVGAMPAAMCTFEAATWHHDRPARCSRAFWAETLQIASGTLDS